VLSFRGTNGPDLDNWVTNINGARISYPGVAGGLVHAGFYGAYQKIKSQVRSAMSNLISAHPNSKIFITGHSLGGALAVLAAMDIKAYLSPSQMITLYTYGQPRVGNVELSNYIFSLFD
jgi:predicted lipase